MYLISKFIGNESFFVKSYRKMGRKYSITFTYTQDQAMCFADKQAAQFEAEALQVATGKIFFVDQLPAESLAGSILRKGSIITLLLFIFASCSHKIVQYQISKVNGQRFKVEGKRGVFIAPKDSIVKVGQWVPVKTIF